MSTAITPAAGAVLWRRGLHAAEVEIALVHRPRYRDWTLPKGKLQPDEHSLMAAVREINEETGAVVQVSRRLASTRYPVPGGEKSVSYWSMRYLTGDHVPGAEVDLVSWLSVPEAMTALTYNEDRRVVQDFVSRPLATSSLLFIRHAKAGKRGDFSGDDKLRPLVKIGRRQARDCAAFLAAFGPTTVLSAEPLRCRQTVEPLAQLLNQPVTSGREFSDAGYDKDPDSALKATLDLLQPDAVTVICSQGGAIPGLLAGLGVAGKIPVRKGSLWVLSFKDTTLIGADYYPRPQT